METEMNQAEVVWKGIVSPDEPDLRAEVAEYFLSLSFTDVERARYRLLAAKDQSELTRDERSELEVLVAANTFLMLVQSKARLSLKRQQPAA
jgi:hypothetical protein